MVYLPNVCLESCWRSSSISNGLLVRCIACVGTARGGSGMHGKLDQNVTTFRFSAFSFQFTTASESVFAACIGMSTMRW